MSLAHKIIPIPWTSNYARTNNHCFCLDTPVQDAFEELYLRPQPHTYKRNHSLVRHNLHPFTTYSSTTLTSSETLRAMDAGSWQRARPSDDLQTFITSASTTLTSGETPEAMMLVLGKE